MKAGDFEIRLGTAEDQAFMEPYIGLLLVVASEMREQVAAERGDDDRAAVNSMIAHMLVAAAGVWVRTAPAEVRGVLVEHLGNVFFQAATKAATE